MQIKFIISFNKYVRKGGGTIRVSIRNFQIDTFCTYLMNGNQQVFIILTRNEQKNMKVTKYE